MRTDRKQDAHAAILPAFDTTTLSHSVRQFLENGGCSILLGESRVEYVARRVSDARKSTETPDTIQHVIHEAASLSGSLLVAVDQEIGGICRLHNLVPQFPSAGDLASYDSAAFAELSFSIATAAKRMGVNCFLGPILDVVTGQNPWLSGRTWSTNPETIARLSSAYIRGVQSAGVAATAKHFPGFHNIPLDPAVEPDAVMEDAESTFQSGFIPFEDAIRNNVETIMVGPAVVAAFDAEKPASISPRIIGMLRETFGFEGVVMSDDLDSKATMRGRSIEEVAVDALNAGSDFLLLAAIDDQLERVTDAICKAVERGELDEERLHDAATGVRALAEKYTS